ncbi:MAG TPA: EAL domain-containing protein [Burkholderiales bacterium]|nr:EAL domain-containing protein [Burkholderiales bacterium]
MASANLPVRARNVMVLGFGVVIAITAVLVALDLMRLESVRARVQELVQAHGARSELVSQLLAANLARAEALHLLMAARDSGRRAQAEAQFRAASRRFSQVTERLRAASPLPGDGEALGDALEAAEAARRVEEEVVQLVMDGEAEAAERLHARSEEAYQDRLAEKLTVLEDRQRLQMLEAADRVDRESRETLTLTMGLRFGALLVGMLVAYLVIRYIYEIGEALHREKERAEVALHSIGDGVITIGPDGAVDYLNPVAEKLTGWMLEAARGRPLQEVYSIVDEDSREPAEYRFDDHGFSRKRGVATAGVRLLSRDGREFPVEDTVSPIRDRDGRTAGSILVFHDVTHLRTMARQLSWQASHDPLTGLANRREFERRLAEMLETARAQGKQHALLYLDLDKFKLVNDQCGHIAGDDMLRQLAAAMQACIRGSDTLARLGGDEFGVLLEACPLDQAIRIANELCETVRDFRFLWRGAEYGVGASVGLVPLSDGTQGVERAMEAADESCYAAKSRGGNRIQIYRAAESGLTGHHRDVIVVSRIDEAFEHGNFRLYRQAIAPVAGEGSVHYEVLVRMVDELGMLIPPTEFLPTAERYSLLPILDRWVISKVVDYLAHHTKRANHVQGELPFYAVNISGASINDSTFSEFLRRLLSEQHVPSELVCFEITETVAIANLTKAGELMHELKTLGCRFALDDFGIGVSSFAYLKFLPVDYLKIDGTFIRDLARNPMDYAIVEAIARIGHVMGMRTVAECVEDAATLDRLRQLKVDFAQGTAVGHPELMDVRVRPREVTAS